MATQTKKLEAQGGTGGSEWDNGVFEGVRKVHVGVVTRNITYLKFEYDNGGKVETREHGKRFQQVKVFELDYPREYITSVEGTIGKVRGISSDIITSITIKTSRGRTSPTYGSVSGRRFVLEDDGRRLVGFYGRAGDTIDALGAYSVRSSIISSNLVEEVQAQGGTGGDAWDDGINDGVRKVVVSQNEHGISYVKFEYDKQGSSVIHEHGHIGRQPIEFVLDYPNEHIVSVEGTIKAGFYVSVTVTSLVFKTSKQRTSPTFGTVTGERFVLENKGGKLIGFLGRSGDAIDALGARFAPISSPSPSPKNPPKELKRYGGNGGGAWDDGINNGVRKLWVGQNQNGITYIKFEYDKYGTSVARDHGRIEGQLMEFVLDYPNEYIVSVEGTTKYSNYGTVIVTSLIFKTSKQRTSPTFGIVAGDKFVLEDKGGILIGFHGRSGYAIDALGAYSVQMPSPSPKNPLQDLKGYGGNGGGAWDDGVNNGIRKLWVGDNEHGIAYFKIEYDKFGTLVTRDHGKISRPPIQFVLDYPNEHIVSVEGTTKFSNYGTIIVTSLIFKTSKQRTSQRFGIETGEKFVLEDEGGMLVGFHGRSGDAIDALGAYFLQISSDTSPFRSELMGSNGGVAWDDGVFDGVRKVCVGKSSLGYIKFEYEKGGNIHEHDHGKNMQEVLEFVIDYPNENLTEVEGTFVKDFITSLSFKTSKQRLSPRYGAEDGTKFVLKGNGQPIVGFHGRSGDDTNALGAYFGPIVNAGTAWKAS